MVAMTHLRATFSSYAEYLDESNALASCVLLQEHSAEFGKSFGRIVEGAEDAFSAVPDVERENHRLYRQGSLEHGRGRLVDDRCKLAHEYRADGYSGEPHQGDHMFDRLRGGARKRASKAIKPGRSSRPRFLPQGDGWVAGPATLLPSVASFTT
jgi:hypothetical protein